MDRTDRTSSSPGLSELSASRPTGGLLAFLTVIYTLYYVDRSILLIVGQPIKEILKLTDWQLGLLGGIAFTLFYSLLGIPLAQLVERHNRVTILSICLLVWSSMTALSGFARSFVQLFLLRMGVGIGEAGFVPAAHSLIADNYAPDRRATAIAIFALGIPAGALVGDIVGGAIIDHFGWRAAFLTVGAPGIVVACAMFFCIRDTARGRYDRLSPTGGAFPDEIPKYIATAQYLWRVRTSRYVIAAITTTILIGSASGTFLIPYLVRKFSLDYSTVGLVVGLTTSVGSAVGTLGGGFLSDRLGARRDPRWYAWLPALGLVISMVLYGIVYAQNSLSVVVALLTFPSIFGSAYFAPSYAILHNTVLPRMRATTMAIVQLCVNMLGFGVGPIIGGLAIDILSRVLFARQRAGTFVLSCPGGVAVDPKLLHACHAALAGGTQWMLIGCAPFFIIPIVLFFLAARTIPNQWPTSLVQESHC